ESPRPALDERDALTLVLARRERAQRSMTLDARLDEPRRAQLPAHVFRHEPRRDRERGPGGVPGAKRDDRSGRPNRRPRRQNLEEVEGAEAPDGAKRARARKLSR